MPIDNEKKKKALYEKKLRDMIEADRVQAQPDTYQEDPSVIDAVNKVTKSGEPLRRKYSPESEAQMAADKKALEETLAKKKKKGY